jgi:proteic killer suppression protein
MAISSFKHRELKKLANGKNAKINNEHVNKLLMLFSMLNHLKSINDLYNSRSFKPHPLDGKLKGYWSIEISGNWRVTFKFEDGNVKDLDYIDYH